MAFAVLSFSTVLSIQQRIFTGGERWMSSEVAWLLLRNWAVHLVRIATHRPLSSPFLGLPERILNIGHKKELLWGPWLSHTFAKYIESRSKLLGDGGFQAVPVLFSCTSCRFHRGL